MSHHWTVCFCDCGFELHFVFLLKVFSAVDTGRWLPAVFTVPLTQVEIRLAR